MKINKTLNVEYKGKTVGTLAMTKNGKVAFQYDDKWLETGFSISPFALPLSKEVFVPNNMVFGGLFGCFSDSLPDAWGNLLLDRMLASNGINPADLNPLDRLSIIGNTGMGALEYVPKYNIKNVKGTLSLDELAKECEKILSEKECDNIDELFARGGSSGGARPKALVKLNDEDWIVKFPYSKDAADSGKREYQFSLLAKECGINMPETKLLDSKICSGYFAIKRFDRPKCHMLSAAALLDVDFERSLTDYKDLLKLTNILTNGNKDDILDMYRRMCFNVLIENQDDHLKNFSYLYDDKLNIWHLSPAYDLTDTKTGFGEHTTTVNGKGKNIVDSDLIEVGTVSGISEGTCKEIIKKMQRILR